MLGAVVFTEPDGRQPCCVRGCAGLQSSGARTEAARRDSGLVLSEVRRHKYRPSAFRGGLTFFSEVDLRNNAVRIGDSSRLRGWRRLSRGAENVLRTEESTLEKQVSYKDEDSYFPRCGAFGVRVIIGLHIFCKCCPESVRVRVPSAAAADPLLQLVPVRWLLVPGCYPLGIIMQLLGVVLSTSSSNISIWNSVLATPGSGIAAKADVRGSLKIHILHLQLRHVAGQVIWRTSVIFVINVPFLC